MSIDIIFYKDIIVKQYIKFIGIYFLILVATLIQTKEPSLEGEISADQPMEKSIEKISVASTVDYLTRILRDARLQMERGNIDQARRLYLAAGAYKTSSEIRASASFNEEVPAEPLMPVDLSQEDIPLRTVEGVEGLDL